MLKRIYFIAFIVFSFSNLYCGELGDFVYNLQENIRQIQRQSFSPKSKEEFDSLRKSFNINKYFDVLKNLSLENGYKFDYYMQQDQYGSFPVLLTLNNDDFNFLQYIFTVNEKPSEDSIKMIRKKIDNIINANCTKDTQYNLPQSMNSEDCIGFLEHIKTNNTVKSYLEFITLRIIGNQFLLVWHAGYNDRYIVSTKQQINSIISKIGPEKSMEEVSKIQKIDYEPSVEINKDNIKVRVIVFTRWGGLIEVVYNIDKNDNNITLKSKQEKTLVDYDCGITF